MVLYICLKNDGLYTEPITVSTTSTQSINQQCYIIKYNTLSDKNVLRIC